MMLHSTVKSCVIAGAALVVGMMPALAATKIELWHGMGSELGKRVEELAQSFNESQKDYVVKPVYKGSYEEITNAMIAAYRAKKHPHIVQINERGFLTMINSGTIIPAADLMRENGYTVDWNDFLPPVTGYYAKDGTMMPMPFNSSTPILFYNRDHFKAAGFEAPGETWQELEKQLYTIQEKGVSKCGMGLPGDYEWSLIENYSAVNTIPYATKRNGLGGLDTELVFNKQPMLVGQIERLARYYKDGVMEIAGQGNTPIQLFTSGKCSTFIASTAMHATVEATAKFDWNATYMPHEEGVVAHNSVIGGAALWTLKGHKPEEYKAVAAFYNYLTNVDTQVWWHKATGYVPITNAAHAKAKAEGYYKEHPTREIAVLQLMRDQRSDNSAGFRLGNGVQIILALKEEIQGALIGKSSAQQALDAAAARGNQILRQYERINGSK